MKTPERPVKHTIPAVIHAMEVVSVLALQDDEATSKSLAIRLGIPRSSCYRILKSLVSQDWVRVVDGGRHMLSLGLMPLLAPLRQAEHIALAAKPAIEALSRHAQMAAKITMRQGDYAVTVARAESPRQTSVAVRLGAAFHLAFGSSGAVLLSGMPKSKVDAILKRSPADCWLNQDPQDVAKRLRDLDKKGWCADFGTYRETVHAISAPIRDFRGNVLASMTLIGFAYELPLERLAEPAKLLLQATRRAEGELRHWTSGLTEGDETSKKSRGTGR